MMKMWIVSGLLAVLICKLVIAVFPAQQVTSWLVDTVGVEKTVPYQMSYEDFANQSATAPALNKSYPPTMTIKALSNNWVSLLSWASAVGVVALFTLVSIGLRWGFDRWSKWERRPVIPHPTLNRRMRLLACAWIFWPLACVAWAMIADIDLSTLWIDHAPLFFLPQAFFTLCLLAVRWIKHAPR